MHKAKIFIAAIAAIELKWDRIDNVGKSENTKKRKDSFGDKALTDEIFQNGFPSTIFNFVVNLFCIIITRNPTQMK